MVSVGVGGPQESSEGRADTISERDIGAMIAMYCPGSSRRRWLSRNSRCSLWKFMLVGSRGRLIPALPARDWKSASASFVEPCISLFCDIIREHIKKDNLFNSLSDGTHCSLGHRSKSSASVEVGID